MKIAYLDGPRLRRSLLAAAEHLRARRGELNRINVFPVPDGDTGSNLALTVHAITDRLAHNRDEPVSTVSHEAAQAAILGARGNSGMMLSQFLLGLAEHFAGSHRVDAAGLRAGLLAGAARVERALDEPTEGTIVTVIRDTARAGAEAGEEDIALLLPILTREARASLARTPDLLPILREAGVVDAGALGFVLLLEGALDYMEGRGGEAMGTNGAETSEGPAAAALTDYASSGERFRYCTEALVEGDTLPTEAEVRSRVGELGDSLQVVRSERLLRVHIHTDDPEGVFARLRAMGELRTHKAEDMRAQHAALERGRAGADRGVRRPVGIVTDSGCDLADEILNAHGIRFAPLGIVDGDRTWLDRVELTARSFHERIAREDTRFTTSQPSPGQWREAFEDAAADAESLVVVTVASGLSGTHGSALAAAAGFEGAPIAVMDSQGVSLLEGLLVLKAAELAEAGHAPDEIVKELERVRDRSGVYLTVDRFDRLLASGRVGPGVAWVGDRLDLKPILRLDRKGTVERAGQVLGRHRVLPSVLRRLEKDIPPLTRRVRFGVSHVARPEIVEEATRALRARWDEVEVLTAAATPVVANHVGLGAWAIAWIVED